MTASVLSRTKDPQLSDISIDQVYFNELSSLSKELGSVHCRLCQASDGYSESAYLHTFSEDESQR